MAEGDTHTIYSDSFVPLNELVTRLGTLLYRCLSCSGSSSSSFQSKEKRDLHCGTEELLSLHKCIREAEFYRQSITRLAVTNNGHPQGCKWVLQTNKTGRSSALPECVKAIQKLSFLLKHLRLDFLGQVSNSVFLSE